MATWNSNTVGYSNVSTAAVPELIYGTKWGGGLGTPVTLQFSFMNSASLYLGTYGSHEEPDDAYFLSAAEQTSVRNALSVISSVINVNFTEVTDSASLNGDIRFGGTYNHSPQGYAHAYYPWNSPEAGDVWFSENWNTGLGAMAPGSYDFLTIVHEMGHALGLKHPHEGGATLSSTYDNYFYTVMSYRASPWSPAVGIDGDNYASFYPTTLMWYDLVALQSLYGRRTTHNTGNTVYTFNDGQTYFQTIDDAGGVDTIRFVGSEMCEIWLDQGYFSQLSEGIVFDNGPGTTISRYTVAIGPNTIIENATGGNGNDLINGNGVNNTLNGGAGVDTMNGLLGNDRLIGAAGNDKLNGAGGLDTLEGGAGHDRLVGGGGADKFVFNAAVTAANSDTIIDFAHNADKIYLENGVMAALGATTGALAAGKFWAGAAAHDGSDRIIYHAATGNLYYDSNGNAAGGSVLLAKLDAGLVITASDFVVI